MPPNNVFDRSRRSESLNVLLVSRGVPVNTGVRRLMASWLREEDELCKTVNGFDSRLGIYLKPSLKSISTERFRLKSMVSYHIITFLRLPLNAEKCLSKDISMGA